MLRTKDSTGMQSQRGFTITELIVVLGIMATVMLIAMPTMSRYQRQSRLNDAARRVEGDFELIRNTARARQERNVVALVTATGIFAFVDADGSLTFDAGENVILDDQFTGGTTLAITSTTAGAATPFGTVTYNAVGNIRDTTNRVITITTPGENRQYQVTLYSTGSSRVLRSEDGGTTWPTRAW